jgi:predicted AAA+ superfamily ATPase
VFILITETQTRDKLVSEEHWTKSHWCKKDVTKRDTVPKQVTFGVIVGLKTPYTSQYIHTYTLRTISVLIRCSGRYKYD